MHTVTSRQTIATHGDKELVRVDGILRDQFQNYRTLAYEILQNGILKVNIATGSDAAAVKIFNDKK